MALGTDGGSTGPSLEDFAGMALDGYAGDDEAESPESGAGDPPAQSLETPAVGPEGTADAEHAGDPPAVAADANPDPAAPEVLPQADPDPLAAATPATYMVDGQQRTYDGIKVLGEHGGIVPAEHLPKLLQRLSERDHLFETSQKQHQKFTDLEKVTAWHVRDADGTNRTLTGREAAEAHRVVTARSLATLQVLTDAFTDPAKFAALVSVAQDNQGNPVIVPDQQALSHLFTQAELAAIRGEQGARSFLATLAAPTPTAPAADVPIQDVAVPTVEANLRALGITAISPESKAFLVEQLPRYVRATTPQERQADPTIGPRIVDHSFVALAKREASRASEAKQIASATTAASTTNAARLAAAAVGKRPTAPSRPAPSANPARESDADKAWDLRERAAMASF